MNREYNLRYTCGRLFASNEPDKALHDALAWVWANRDDIYLDAIIYSNYFDADGDLVDEFKVIYDGLD